MASRYALDTGVAHLLAQKNTAIVEKLRRQATFIPVIVVAELYFGAFQYAYRNQSTKYLDMYDELLSDFRNRILRCNQETAHIYGALAAELMAKGRPMQQNDMWIAALARQYGLTLLTLDDDFTNISSLDYELWPRP